MSWVSHHSQSEHYANLAEEALREQNNARAIELYRLAAEAEILALEALEPTKTRTIGITAVSAASLLYKAQEFRSSEQLAYQWLITDLLPAFAIRQLQELLQVIWSSRELVQKRA
ncbi:hypothetical protein DSM106972_099450 [Dulcicalothrix desertica PCC 7102]|uniref:DUF309 domain-containing protein n=1 Tax=Dulcicalothrix desertica PCC 7102 TaxID=232991 RepID=A0A3S1I572_9CYAN|nr:hypothetical protein [Dulcicalothrix desertica]RUS92344.1 hypothetical protein DSM106972_099450 [Dulcicalothrix desertica PCC 7102]TWH61461.1 hypothetical protein CAL7102_01029 [Dulcicalothrix desertica PCC 7102]